MARIGITLTVISVVTLSVLLLYYAQQISQYGFFIRNYYFDLALKCSKFTFILGVMLICSSRYIQKLFNWIKTGHFK